MDLKEDVILQFTTGWNESVSARILAVLACLLLLSVAFSVVRRKRPSFVPAAICLILGMMFLLFSIWPQRMVDMIISTPYDIRVRFIMGGVSLIVFFITLESIRRTHLQERYALLWLATAAVIFMGALSPQTVALLRAVTGMEYVTALIAVAFTFLVLVTFHFSISISSSRSNQARIAQRVAILEERIERLEESSPSAENSTENKAGREGDAGMESSRRGRSNADTH